LLIPARAGSIDEDQIVRRHPIQSSNILRDLRPIKRVRKCEQGGARLCAERHRQGKSCNMPSTDYQPRALFRTLVPQDDSDANADGDVYEDVQAGPPAVKARVEVRPTQRQDDQVHGPIEEQSVNRSGQKR
jgi:hypothetical protein